MASPAESKADENEVTSHPHSHRRHRREDDDDLGFALTRQSSIYSLTLDEIQNTVCEPGRNFGSMNMDEFLNNIWNVEEAGSFPGGSASANANANAAVNLNVPAPAPLPLARQGSIAVPAPLCRKTVDEVWAEIHKEEGEEEDVGGGQNDVDRQQTMGEMTLEDFLVKAGVVRGGFGPNATVAAASQQQQQPAVAEAAAVVPMHHNYGGMVSYPQLNGNVELSAGLEYHHQPQQQQVVEGYGLPVTGKAYQLSLGSPASPMSSDGGMGSGHVDNGGGGGVVGGTAEANSAGMKNGRKRIADGGVEKVVERRQRRMIKNRESAARSRARKQAYTVELEAELNLLKEDNARLRAEERRAHAMRKKMIADCMAEHARNNAEKTVRTLRRCTSSPW
ncbi:ABA response element binding factor [Iris pallida]|uniref:ABA response element binding factor n=1 Tax=Iris pallida TaxID=29817 RepID=A0AAX6E344_IRIPA|nr:ABA response element binding factor [Iris pallida]